LEGKGLFPEASTVLLLTASGSAKIKFPQVFRVWLKRKLVSLGQIDPRLTPAIQMQNVNRRLRDYPREYLRYFNEWKGLSSPPERSVTQLITSEGPSIAPSPFRSNMDYGERQLSLFDRKGYNMIKELIKIANELDERGLVKEADDLDNIASDMELLKKAAIRYGDWGDWLVHDAEGEAALDEQGRVEIDFNNTENSVVAELENAKNGPWRYGGDESPERRRDSVAQSINSFLEIFSYRESNYKNASNKSEVIEYLYNALNELILEAESSEPPTEGGVSAAGYFESRRNASIFQSKSNDMAAEARSIEYQVKSMIKHYGSEIDVKATSITDGTALLHIYANGDFGAGMRDKVIDKLEGMGFVFEDSLPAGHTGYGNNLYFGEA